MLTSKTITTVPDDEKILSFARAFGIPPWELDVERYAGWIHLFAYQVADEERRRERHERKAVEQVHRSLLTKQRQREIVRFVAKEQAEAT